MYIYIYTASIYIQYILSTYTGTGIYIYRLLPIYANTHSMLPPVYTCTPTSQPLPHFPANFSDPGQRSELFAWFVDTLQNVKGRIMSSLLIQQAEKIKSDYTVYMNTLVSRGAMEQCDVKIPQINKHWLLKWRLEFKLSWRTVNLRFKCSHKKLMRRLEIFWVNIFHIRWLHYYLNDEQQLLKFSNSDQKPLWSQRLFLEAQGPISHTTYFFMLATRALLARLPVLYVWAHDVILSNSK